MSELKWIKISLSMFDDEKVKIIDTLPERDAIFNIWVKLLVQAGKCNTNGYIFLTENIPYNEEMLAAVFNRPINTIRLALQTLKDFGMIDIYQNSFIKICNWEKHQNIEGMEKIREQNRLRKQKQRAQESLLTAPAKEEMSPTSDVTGLSRDSHATEREREEEREEERDIEEEREKEEDKISVAHDETIEVCKFYEAAGFGTVNRIVMDKLEALVEIYTKQWVTEAIEMAVLRGKYKLTYVEGILQNWKAEGKKGVGKGGSSSKDSGTSTSEIYDFSRFGG